ncbi:MAG: hypothetical protein OQK24_05745 [Magnetovibrio sp.]|nr:hypothetical protein [Magnetovibrio sp.]
MKLLHILLAVFLIMVFTQNAVSAGQERVASVSATADYVQIIKDYTQAKTSQLMTVQSNIADGGSCSVTCTKGSSSKTCANQGENCSCSCQNDYPDCTACSK